jgi:hypothetical protein
VKPRFLISIALIALGLLAAALFYMRAPPAPGTAPAGHLLDIATTKAKYDANFGKKLIIRSMWLHLR